MAAAPIQSICRSIALGAVASFTVACNAPLMDLGEEITLSASITELGRPLETRNRFSLEDDRIYVHVAIPAETAGPERRDFHFEYRDGEGRIVNANGGLVTRPRAEWRVGSSYRINPEIDAPGLWSLDVYVDGRHLERLRFPVTAGPGAPLPDGSAVPSLSADCCEAPGALAFEVYLSTGADDESARLVGRRERFRLSDEKLNVYLRFANIPNGTYRLRYDFYDGNGKPLWRYEYSMESASRGRVAWAWRNFVAAQDTPGLWTVDIHMNDMLLGSVQVPVDP